MKHRPTPIQPSSQWHLQQMGYLWALLYPSSRIFANNQRQIEIQGSAEILDEGTEIGHVVVSLQTQ